MSGARNCYNDVVCYNVIFLSSKFIHFANGEVRLLLK